MDRREWLGHCRLYFICDSRPGGRPLLDVLVPALAGGVDIFQLRDKHATDDELVETAIAARAACVEHGAMFILNDRPDLVEATAADGVHIGQDDMAIEKARAIVGDDILIGVSTHSPEDLAHSAGADYAGVGPVHETPTKPGRQAAGLDYVRHAVDNAQIPFFAIGGLHIGNVDEVVATGATRVAVVRAIAEADDPLHAAAQLRGAVTIGDPHVNA